MPFKPRSKSAEELRKASRATYERRHGTSAERGYAGKAWQALRRATFLRDMYKCQMCGVRVGMLPRDAHCDHVIAKADGGEDELSNTRTLCARCHSSRTMKDNR